MSGASSVKRHGDCRMEQLDLLRRVVRAIEDLGLRYFVTGSMATIFYGEPRLTNDIDVVMDLPEPPACGFMSRMPYTSKAIETCACSATAVIGSSLTSISIGGLFSNIRLI